MIPPTKEQARTLEAIRALSVDGVSPTYAELAAELGLSSRGHVHRRLTEMRERGLIDFAPRLSRSIRIIDNSAKIKLTSMSNEQLTALLYGIVAELAGRWKL